MHYIMFVLGLVAPFAVALLIGGLIAKKRGGVHVKRNTVGWGCLVYAVFFVLMMMILTALSLRG